MARKRPILLMAHTDVVGRPARKMAGVTLRRGSQGRLHLGRGSRDDKDKLAANLMVMLLAKRNGAALDRDLDLPGRIRRRSRPRRPLVSATW